MPDTQEPTRTLTARERGERVLNSQGRAIGLLPSLDDDLQQKLAELCDEQGNVKPEAVVGVREILTEYYDRHKAVIADEPAA